LGAEVSNHDLFPEKGSVEKGLWLVFEELRQAFIFCASAF
jgi:hypothetical protein